MYNLNDSNITQNIKQGTLSVIYGYITYYALDNYVQDFAIKIYITKPYLILGSSLFASVLLYKKLNTFFIKNE